MLRFFVQIPSKGPPSVTLLSLIYFCYIITLILWRNLWMILHAFSFAFQSVHFELKGLFKSYWIQLTIVNICDSQFSRQLFQCNPSCRFNPLLHRIGPTTSLIPDTRIILNLFFSSLFFLFSVVNANFVICIDDWCCNNEKSVLLPV